MHPRNKVKIEVLACACFFFFFFLKHWFIRLIIEQHIIIWWCRDMRSRGRNISGDAVSVEFFVGSPGFLPRSWLGEVGVPGVDGSCSLPPSQLLDSGMGVAPYVPWTKS